MKFSSLWLIAVVLLLAHCQKKSSGETVLTPVEIKDSVLVQNLSYPWEILWGPDNYIWMTERPGRISRINPESGAVTPLITISEVVTNNEGGLLGMVLHPGFPGTPYVYVVYNYTNAGNYLEKVVRYTYNGSSLVSPFTLIDNIKGSFIHDGSRLLITGNKLYITTGDASDPPIAQNTGSPNGKILRLNLDGSIPSDNPVAGNPYWTYGHRNPQGLVYAHNILYSSEHGPSNDDEINIIEKGRNYGWPDVEGTCNTAQEQSFCAANNVKEPIKTWTPTIAPSGLDYYDNNRIPQWKNSLLLATLKNSRLYQMKLDDSYTSITETNEYFTNKYGRMRDICISPAGRVYICTSNGSNDRVIVIDKK